MAISLQLERSVKLFLINAKVHRFTRPFANILKKIGFLIDLSEWCAARETVQIDRHEKTFLHNKRYQLYEFLFKNHGLNAPVSYLEFGVASGNSIKWWVEHNADPNSRFVGFDTFTGLPEDWSGGFREGAFSTGGKMPLINDSRCCFQKGLFQETLPAFLSTYQPPPERKQIIHLDADLYSSTLYVLTSLAGILKAGDVLIFDEFNVPLHEFRAFHDFVAAYRIEYKVIGAVNSFHAVAIELK
ncbi:MAG: macrocin O-methyltransferase [Chlorobiales bacterium]|nr:macrocin O-methyltransferase [Chlorobiales bacterium]